MMEWSPEILAAIKSGYIPPRRPWRTDPTLILTMGEKVCKFIEGYVLVPEGPLVGQLMRLLPFQEIFILAIFDGQTQARKAILSVGRKSGKTAIIAALMLAFMYMKGLTSRNSRVNSAALSRDQAALIHNYMLKSIMMSPQLNERSKSTPSNKKIRSLSTGIEYHALAAEAGKAMGLSPAVIVGDEWGQVIGPINPFIDALLTSQGAHESPLAIIISTQSPSDADWLSIQIDDATRAPSEEVVCHLYTADITLEIDDPIAWSQACPAIGVFRSTADVKMQAEQALRLPVTQASFRNLILNQRVSLDKLWLAPSVWKENSDLPDLDKFRDGRVVSLGLDLSTKTDLTAAVLSCEDDEGIIHILPFVFAPLKGLQDRELRDRAPYALWEKQGHLIVVPGPTISYEWVFDYLKQELTKLDIRVDLIIFDRWRIAEARGAADRNGFVAGEWLECGQGYQSMSPRMEFFETKLLQNKIRHGSHPLLNMAASNCITESDPAGNKKPAKNKSTQRIDPLVAAIMSAGAFMEAKENFNVENWIG